MNGPGSLRKLIRDAHCIHTLCCMGRQIECSNMGSIERLTCVSSLQSIMIVSSVLADCRMQRPSSFLSILEKVWADQDREAAANRKTAQIPTEAAPARPSGPPADGTDADELLSTATAKGAHVGLYMTFSGKESLWLLSRQGHDSAGDVAADMIRRRQQQAGGQAMWLQDYIAAMRHHALPKIL